MGDKLYGSARELVPAPNDREFAIALHALRLEFRHPQTAIHTSATAETPDSWKVFDPFLVRAIQALFELSTEQRERKWLLDDIAHAG